MKIAHSIIKHMFAKGYDAYEDETRYDTPEELIALVDDVDEAAIRFDKFGEKPETVLIVNGLTDEESIADYVTGGEIEWKYNELTKGVEYANEERIKARGTSEGSSTATGSGEGREAVE